MKKLWLLFAQTATVAVAALFVVTTLKPEWLAATREAAPSPVVVQQAAPQREATAKAASYSDAVAKAAPAVVYIFTSGTARGSRQAVPDDPVFRRFFGDSLEDPRGPRLGSGVIVSAKGYLLTNNHVVEGMEEIEVLLADGKTRLKAKLVGTDPETDLAVLKVDRENLPAVAFGTAETVRVGDVVLAIGNPFGVGQTVTMGIVSGLGRRGLNLNTYENFIQTDASINPGNSGGPLIDAAGNLIGINTAIFSRTGGSVGIGFAIPVSTAKAVLEQIVEQGGVTRGYIGVQTQGVSSEVAEALKTAKTSGVLIAGVERDGPAEKAGVKAGDVLLAVNTVPTPDTATMLDTVADLKPGSQASLKLRRDQKELDLQVTVGKRPAVQRRRGARVFPRPSRRRTRRSETLRIGVRRDDLAGARSGATRNRESRLAVELAVHLGAGRRLPVRLAGGLHHEAGEKEPELVEQAHRNGEQELRQHVGRRDDRRHHERADDHVGARRLQLLDRHDARAREHHDHHRDLERHPEGEEHRQHEAEVGLDVRRRRDALRREAVDEGEHLAEDEVVAERDPGEEEHRARDHERQRQPLLVGVEARRDERPRLVEHVGQHHDQRDPGGDLDRHHERRDHAGGDHLRPLRQRLRQRRREKIVDRPGARVQEQHDEREPDREQRPQQPVA
jgi:Do/DeqQ family serine protease